MRLPEALQYAKEHTQILRARKNLLYTFGATRLPYVCLAENGNRVRILEGEVTASRPNILFPGRDFTFAGFADGDAPDDDALPVLLARSIQMPVGNYSNRENTAREENGDAGELADREIERLEKANDIRTGVIRAPECVWRLAVLLYVGVQAARSSESNITECLEHLRARPS